MGLNISARPDTKDWLHQKPAISKHLKNIFESRELNLDSVISILETTESDGKKYQVMYYNLDAIISVGYRVNSSRSTQFRIWVTETLKEYIIKGFAMDDFYAEISGRIYRISSGEYSR